MDLEVTWLREVLPFQFIYGDRSIAHSKLDYCNSVIYDLPKTHVSRLQLIQNMLARIVTRTSKFSHILPILQSLHWLKINQRMQYVISPTYDKLHCSKPVCLRRLITPTTSSLLHPTDQSSLKICSHAFSFAAPQFWNSLDSSSLFQ